MGIAKSNISISIFFTDILLSFKKVMIFKYLFLNSESSWSNNVCEYPIVIKLDKDKEFPPTFILHNDYLPGKLQKVYNIMERKWKIKEMHVYTSLGENSTTFSRHCDSANVLIVQSVGRMNYYVEGLGSIECNPGDGMWDDSFGVEVGPCCGPEFCTQMLTPAFYYNPSATIDNGTCQYFGCLNPLSLKAISDFCLSFFPNNFK